MPPYIPDDMPFSWHQEEQYQDQNEDLNPNPNPIQGLFNEDIELNEYELDLAMLQVGAGVELNATDANGTNVAAIYSNLLIEFANAVDRKLVLNRQPATTETAMEHSQLNDLINRLVQEICEFYIRYIRE